MADDWSYVLADETVPLIVPGATPLKFNNGALFSGTDKQEEAVYKYTNVVTIDGVQIDAYVKIESIQGAELTSIDNNNPTNATAPAGMTTADFFAPEIKTTAADGGVTFSITFKDTDGNVRALSGFYNNSIDIDAASGNVREFVEYGGFKSYTVNNPTDLQIKAGAVGTGRMRFESGNNKSYDGLVVNDIGRVQTQFDTVSTFTIKMGATGNVGSTARQYGSIFASMAFSNPLTTEAPTVDALRTNDLTPILTGTVGNTLLGESEAFSVNVNGKTYEKGDPELTINDMVWTLEIPVGDELANEDKTYEVKALRGGVLYDQTANELIIDVTPPTVVDAIITMDKSSLKAGDTALVTIQFSEAVKNFDNDDLTIEGGTLTAIVSSDGGITWTATFTPTADLEDTSNVITLNNAGVTDLAGNSASGTTASDNYVIDTKPPVIDLDPSDASTLNHSANVLPGVAVGIDDNDDAASVIEGNGIASLVLTVAGLSDGDDELLSFDDGSFYRANGSAAVGTVTVGSVSVQVTANGTSGGTSGTFTIVKSGGGDLTAAETASIIQALEYKNASTTPTGGDRSFSFTATDAAGNATASAAVSTVTVDDDRDITVTGGGTFNEASTYATFTVTADGEVGDAVLLELGNTADTADRDATISGFAIQYSTNDGEDWETYTWNGASGNRPTVPSDGQILVRVDIGTEQDDLYEGAETFTLTASYATNSAKTSTDTATIVDDNTGRIDVNGDGDITDADEGEGPGTPGGSLTFDDDRAITVTGGGTFNEASTYATFTVDVTGEAGDKVELTLGNTEDPDDQNATVSGFALHYSTNGGTSWTTYSGSSQPEVPASGSGQILVRVDITSEQDDLYEGAETFTLTANYVSNPDNSDTGLATIVDDGTGTILVPTDPADPSKPHSSNPAEGNEGHVSADDDRSINVNDITVNEASSHGVFTVTGTQGQHVVLALTGGTATGGAIDFGSGGAANLQYWNGETWSNYTGAIALPDGGTLLVRTPLVNDNIYEGSETFTLTVTPVGGHAATGTATIQDDGTGTLFDPDTGEETPTDPSDEAYITRDDDRAVSVNGITVNEASSHGVFTVTGTQGQQIVLALTDGTAVSNGSNPDFGPGLQYFNGTTWQTYTAGTAVTIANADGTLLVRTPLVNDNTYEGSETFTLTATPVGGQAATGTATIQDDGTGTLFDPDTGEETPTDPSDEAYITRDDDRAVSVNDITVNEASSHGVFIVEGDAGRTVTLALTGGTATGQATGGGIDFGSGGATNLQYWDGEAWSNYTGAIALPDGGTLLVRTPLVNDNTYEGSETFTLTVTPAGGQAVTGTATIQDDGTGTIFKDNGTPDSEALKDDDRAVSVNDIAVNEASSHAVFTVEGDAGRTVTLALTGGTATGQATGGGIDFGSGGATNLQYWDGEAWSNYTGTIALPVGGTLLVRTPIVNDDLYESSETFTLTVTPAGGQAVTGTATIQDDGTGTIFKDNGTPDSEALKDDDRAVSVNDIIVNEASSHAVFTVTGTQGQQIVLALTDGTAVSSGSNPDFGPGLQYFNGTTWQNYAAGTAVTIANADATLLVRTPIVNDTLSESSETFTLTATPIGGHAAIGTATIRDDGTGDIFDPDTGAKTPADSNTPGYIPRDNDLTVTNPVVNEASGTAVFEVHATPNTAITLALTPETADGSGVDFGSTGSVNLQVSVDGGQTWTNYTGGTVTVPNNGTVLARTPITNDTVSDNNETFSLNVTPGNGGVSVKGTATIKDDGTGDIFKDNGTPDSAAPKDDDRAVSVNDITVNEASSHGVFTVTGTLGQSITLTLTDGTAVSSGSNPDYGPGLQYYDGETWQTYTGSPVEIINADGTLLIRTPIIDDNTYEGSETFTLTATPIGGQAATGTATIQDNGTGDIFKDDGTPDSAAPKDDDRAVSVNDITVNEASSHAVFTVTGTQGQEITLSLTPGTATGGGVDFGSANPLQVSIDGGATWTDYTGAIALPTGGTLLARTPIVNDDVYEGSETFTLTVTPAGGQAVTGTATIQDDGAGDIFKDDGTPDSAAPKDDDRAVSVNDIIVNEASSHAVFTVTGTQGQEITLSLTPGTATGGGVDFGSANPLQVSIDGGATWTDYTGAIALPTGGTLLARTPIVNDDVYEGSETFTLTVTPAGGQAVIGTATIQDDGAGDIFKDDGTPDSAAPKDDDRAVSVNDIIVNEASSHAVFTVTGTQGQEITLSLTPGTATGGGVDFGSANPLQVSIDGGATWTDYTGAIALPTGGTLLARTPIVNDDVYEGSETFTLTVTPAGGQAVTGTATIQDDGAGDIFKDDGTPDSAVPKDDDRSITVTGGGTFNEASTYATFTVDVTGKAGDKVELTLGNTADAADRDATVSGFALHYSTNGGTSWTTYSGSSRPEVPAGGSGQILVRVDITSEQDDLYEGAETFTLTANYVSNPDNGDTGLATIVDDGTGTILVPTDPADPSKPHGSNPAEGNEGHVPVNDDRAVSVNDITVNEASSHAVFTVTGTQGQPVSLALTDGTAVGSGANPDFGPDLQYYDGETWQTYTGSPVEIINTDGTLLVRTPIIDDDVTEGSETFTLTVTPAGGQAVTGTATIEDNDEQTVLSVVAEDNGNSGQNPVDDRVVEGESLRYAVTLSGASAIPTEHSVALGGTADSSDYAARSGWTFSGGVAWKDANYNAVIVPEGVTSFTITIGTTDDSLIEDGETLSLTVGGVTGAGTILDNDLPLQVSNIEVNEASPFAIFTVSGLAGQPVSLALAPTGSGEGHAILGVDTANTPSGSALQFFDGNAWQDYVPDSVTNFPAGGLLLVRTGIVNDDPPIYEGPETFQLIASSGGRAFTGTATLLDDGTGTIFTGSVSADTPVTSQSHLDDDRLLRIDNVTVNEKSPYAVFRVSGSTGQQLSLSLEETAARLADGTLPEGHAALGDDTGTQLQYFDGDQWADYVGSPVTYPAGSTTLLVRVAIRDDEVFEGPESFKLKAVTGSLMSYGTGVIGDDGRGAFYNESGAETTDPRIIKDDDRSFSIDSFEVNEGSSFAVFILTGLGGQQLTLRLTSTGVGEGHASLGLDVADTLEVFMDGAWQAYPANDVLTLPEGPGAVTNLLVRVPLINDLLKEGAETFRLTATGLPGSPVVGETFGTATIKDDGTGLKYTGDLIDGRPVSNTVLLDDDFDKDGIAPNVEEILATMSSSTGNGGADGDLNNDGKQDAEQHALATLAWINSGYFDKAIEGTLTEVKPIISLSVVSGYAEEDSPIVGDEFYQLSQINVIPQDAAEFGGHPVSVNNLPNGTTIEAPWDPIQFAITPVDDGLVLQDFDNNPDNGTQVRVVIDISRAKVPENGFNAYLKYVTQAAIDAPGVLLDLNGKEITSAGWYDFTQRTDAAGNPVGDGARFIIKDGLIQAIELTLTDNAFGDNDPNMQALFDPGLPVFIQQPVNPPPVWITSNVSLKKTPVDVDNVQLLNKVVSTSTSAYNCLPDWLLKMAGLSNASTHGIANLNCAGNAKDNILVGNDGKNVLRGLGGNDVLVGSGGSDKLFGGAGADVFKYVELSDSLVGKKNRDVIADFKVNEDKIDLTELANKLLPSGQQFVLVTAFSEQAGELHFDAKTHLLQGDVTGDGIADFEIMLTGVKALTVDNFV
ncbi:Ig-like domain-containing protein [Methylomicrobium album]|uniref:Uncharacterized protein n=1 Tax=Methylomicrobium album BG8 TaxID=686340 RepID=H8GNA1_METAL|nr:Ig-like domain-containing protein [Methylomicrobium album]EIC28330.1 hypothetical protein Metal_0479 [Methylomicrobium album BG8]